MFHQNFQQEKKRREELSKLGLNHQWAVRKNKRAGCARGRYCDLSAHTRARDWEVWCHCHWSDTIIPSCQHARFGLSWTELRLNSWAIGMVRGLNK